MKPSDRNAANLNLALEFYGRTGPGARIEVESGVKLIYSGVATSVFNIALLATPVAPVPGEFERRLQVASAFYRAQGTAWSFWICEELLAGLAPRRLHDACDKFHLACIAESPGMEIDALGAPARELPVVEVRRVDCFETRRKFCDLIAESFQIPWSTAERIYLPEKPWKDAMAGYVGYVNGEALGTTALVRTPESVGIYSVSTRPGHRRKGIAEALMRQALAGFAPGACPIVLQSSRAGLKLYQGLGFRRVTRYFIYSSV